jgi:hypothetical protein
MAHTLTTEELLFLQDMCLDGEFRCHQRAAEAQVRGDYSTAAYEMEVKERYAELKCKLLEALHERGNHGLIAEAQRLRAGLQGRDDAAPDEPEAGGEGAPA